MGALAQKESSTQFYRIVDGSICLKSDTERDGYELFKTQNPQTKAEVSYYIKRFDGLVGMLTAFERVDKPDVHVHGWQLTLSDADGNYALSLKDGNSATSRVLKMLESIDLDKELTIRAWLDTKGERPKTAIVFTQDDQNVPQNYDATSLPKPKERPNGKMDYSESEDFLYDIGVGFGLSLQSRPKVSQNRSEQPETASVAPTVDDPDADYPF